MPPGMTNSYLSSFNRINHGLFMTNKGLLCHKEAVLELVPVYNIPPSTGSTCPLMYVERSEAKNKQALATSSASPARFNGMFASQPATTFGSSTSVISVRMHPGAMTFVRILRDPSSFATDFEKPMIPALEAA